MVKKKVRGAPRKENPRKAMVCFRVVPDKKSKYQRAADREKGGNLTAWLEELADKHS